MKRNRTLLYTTFVIALLFIGTILYGMLSDDDPYKFYTGLGNKISIAPDDSKIAFSYYVDGEQSIYTANPNGSDVKNIAKSSEVQYEHPTFAPDGKKLIFLSKDSDGIKSLHILNQDASEERKLTNEEVHVQDATFSSDGNKVFFIAMEAEEFKKGEASREGFDLYSVKEDGSNRKKLTDEDHFSMNNLTLSPDKDSLFYSEFDGNKERIYSYELGEEEINKEPSIIPKELRNEHDFYDPKLSPDGKHLVFKDVSEESRNSSPFHYELFLLDLEENKVEKKTSLKESVSSPVFFHHENKIAFLDNTNWPNEPAAFQLMELDLAEDNIEAVNIDAPVSTGGNKVVQVLDKLVNSYTLAILYTLLMTVLSVYLYYAYPNRVYLPSIISFVLTLVTLISSFIVAALGSPWAGIGLGMLAVGIFVCSVIIIVFMFIYKRLPFVDKS